MTLEEKIKEVNEKVKKRLDDSKIEYTYIKTTYNPNSLLRDGTPTALFSTTIIKPLFNSVVHIRSDAETLEVVHIQTNFATFADIDTFFKEID